MTYSKGKMLSCSFFKSGQLRGLHFEIPVPDVSETLDQNPCPFLRIPADDQNLDFGILPADFFPQGAPLSEKQRWTAHPNQFLSGQSRKQTACSEPDIRFSHQ